MGILPPGLEDELLADARIGGPSGSGGEHDPVRILPEDLLACDRIVPHDLDAIEGAQQLVQIVREAVVVVDQKGGHSNPSDARWMASTTALALLMHSLYSFSGIESATIPAPDLTKTLPFLR